jgi:hypothetical protein
MRRAIREHWLPPTAKPKRQTMVKHFVSIIRRDFSGSLRAWLAAARCLIECDLANLKRLESSLTGEKRRA